MYCITFPGYVNEPSRYIQVELSEWQIGLALDNVLHSLSPYLHPETWTSMKTNYLLFNDATTSSQSHQWQMQTMWAGYIIGSRNENLRSNIHDDKKKRNWLDYGFGTGVIPQGKTASIGRLWTAAGRQK